MAGRAFPLPGSPRPQRRPLPEAIPGGSGSRAPAVAASRLPPPRRGKLSLGAERACLPLPAPPNGAAAASEREGAGEPRRLPAMQPLCSPLVLLCQVLGAWAACSPAPAAATAAGLPAAPPQRSRSPPAPTPLAPGRRAAAAAPERGALSRGADAAPGGAAGPGGSTSPRGMPGAGRRRARSSERGAAAEAGRGAAGVPRWLPLNASAGGEGSAGGRGNATGRRARLRNPFYPLTEESYGAYAVMCLSVVIFGIGIMGNMAVMCIVCHNYYMRSISNSLLANLAFWDFLIVFFCLPLVIFQELTKKWLLEDFSCKIVPYIEVMALVGMRGAVRLRAAPGRPDCAHLSGRTRVPEPRSRRLSSAGLSYLQVRRCPCSLLPARGGVGAAWSGYPGHSWGRAGPRTGPATTEGACGPIGSSSIGIAVA